MTTIVIKARSAKFVCAKFLKKSKKVRKIRKRRAAFTDSYLTNELTKLPLAAAALITAVRKPL